MRQSEAPSHSDASPALRGVLIVAEVVLSFAWLVVMLMFGLLLLPVWVGILASASPASASGIDLLATVVCILAVLFGVCGVIGVVRVLLIVLCPPVKPKRVRLTLTLIAMGTLALILYNTWFGVPDTVFDALLSFLLPVASTAHLLFLGRRTLFGEALGANRRIAA
jgi:hypothetical protein